MAENRRGKDNRFYFSRGQLVLLGGTFTVSAAIIFLLGIFVGKNIEESKAAKREQPLVKIPVNPASQGAARSATIPTQDEITFNGFGPKPERSPVGAAAKVNDQRLPQKVTRAEAKEAKSQTTGEAADERTPTKRAENATAPDNPAKKAESKATADGKDQGKVWRAQVDAFVDDKSAKQLVERLKNKGYNAYVTEQQNHGKLWYRVNVGKYSSRDEADKVIQTLKTKENFINAFAASK
jgi:DedD protein